MVYNTGGRRHHHRKRAVNKNKDDSLVKITLIQSMLTMAGVTVFLITSLSGGFTNEEKQVILTTLTEPVDVVESVNGIISNLDDSYLFGVAQQVFNSYKQPAQPVEQNIPNIPIQKIEPPEIPVIEPIQEYQSPDKVGVKLVMSQTPVSSNIDIDIPKDVIAGGVVTSGFGFRKHPISGKSDYHTGVDIGAAAGTDIHTPFSGKVINKGVDYAYGNYLIIDHGDGLITYYSHCESISARIGQKVKQNQVIAKVGNTGLSTGPHLHFEIMIDGSYVDPLNPTKELGVI